MWISMCKNSEYNVKNGFLMHNQITLDEFSFLNTVNYAVLIKTIFNKITVFIHSQLCLFKSFLNTFTLYPHKLLLLLLLFKLNIINKGIGGKLI